MTKFLSLLAVVGLFAAPAFANEEMTHETHAEAAKEMACADGDKKCEEAKMAAEKAAEAAPAAGEMEKKVEERAKH